MPWKRSQMNWLRLVLHLGTGVEPVNLPTGEHLTS
jgi:hypothetical protein